MILPFAKFGSLILKTLSKPLANAIKGRTVTTPAFRERIVRFAQAYHRANVQLQRRLYGQATDLEIKPLNEERAVAVASDLVGEMVIFGVGGVIILMEYQRSARSEARKERERKMETEHLQQRDAQLAIEIHMLKQRLEELEKGGGRKWLPSILSIGGSSADREQQPAPTPQSQQELVQRYLPDLPLEVAPAAK